MGIYYDKQRNGWVADYSVRINERRVRKRKFFPTKAEATACLNTQKESFKKFGEASEFDLQNYARYKRLEDSLQDGTLEDAVNFFNSTACRAKSPTLERLIEEYLKAKDCSKEHKVNLKIYLGKLCDTLGDKKITEIKAKHIHKALSLFDYGAVYKNNIRRALVTFFNYCIFQQYTDTNEAEKVPLFKEHRTEVECITVENTKKLFTVLEKHYPELIAFNALRAFAGIRTAHAKTMNWSQINFEEKGIRFSGEGKRVASFLEGYPANLWAWLEKYKNQPIKEKHARETGQIMKCHDIHCPHNGMRHGFASYHLGNFKNINLTTILLMHRGNPRMLFDRYRGVVTSYASACYFETLPQ